MSDDIVFGDNFRWGEVLFTDKVAFGKGNVLHCQRWIFQEFLHWGCPVSIDEELRFWGCVSLSVDFWVAGVRVLSGGR